MKEPRLIATHDRPNRESRFVGSRGSAHLESAQNAHDPALAGRPAATPIAGSGALRYCGEEHALAEATVTADPYPI
jgi:hypothetical protein